MKLPKIEISIKYKGTLKSELKTITGSKDVYDICRVMFDSDIIDWQEQVIMICLNNANKVLGYHKVSSGGLNSAIMDPRVIFTVALNCAGTTSIILAHSHPSGNLRPSYQDDAMTEKIRNAGDLLDIKLRDHLIITSEGYYSYVDENKL